VAIPESREPRDGFFAAALLAAIAIPVAAHAATVVRGGFDGTWNVLIVTQAGSCDQAYRYPFQVSGGRISSAGTRKYRDASAVAAASL